MPILTDEASKRVLLTDGEGIDPVDFNRAQAFAFSRVFNRLLMHAVGDAIGDGANPTDAPFDLESHSAWTGLFNTDALYDFVFAPFPGCAYVRPSTITANALDLVGGPVVFALDDPFSEDDDGEDVGVFEFQSTDAVLTTAVGDAANPRIDLVEVSFAYVDADNEDRDFEDAATGAPTTSSTPKRRKISATVQIKQGTPAATPAYPTPTAGFRAIAAVLVPATHNAVHPSGRFRDLRMPLGGIEVIDVLAEDMSTNGTNPWTVSGFDRIAGGSTTAAADRLVALCPNPSRAARLVGVGICGKAGPNPSATLLRVEHNPALGSALETALADLSPLFDTGGFRAANAVALMDAIAVEGAEVGARVTDRYVGSPMWGGGYAAGLARARDAYLEAIPGRLAVEIRSDGAARVSFVRFYFARGL